MLTDLRSELSLSPALLRDNLTRLLAVEKSFHKSYPCKKINVDSTMMKRPTNPGIISEEDNAVP